MQRSRYTLSASLLLVASASAAFTSPDFQMCSGTDAQACAASGADCKWQPVLRICAKSAHDDEDHDDTHEHGPSYSCDDQDGMRILFDDLDLNATRNFAEISEGYRGFEWGDANGGLYGAWWNAEAGHHYPGAAKAASDGYLTSLFGNVFVNSNTEAPRAAATLSFAPVQHCHFRPSSIILYALHGGRGMHVNITGFYHGAVTRSRTIRNLPAANTLVDIRRLGEVDKVEITYWNATSTSGDGDSLLVADIIIIPTVPIDSMVKKLAVCLPSDAGVFATVPGYGCNGLDDDCKGGPDDCLEDKFKPAFKNPNCRADLAKMWATDMDDAEAKLCENLDPEDDCTPHHHLDVNVTKTGKCSNTTWTVSVKDMCNNTQTTTVVMPFDNHGPHVHMSSDVTTFTRSRGKLTDIGFHLEVVEDCHEEVQVKLEIFSDEGYTAENTQHWQSKFASAAEVRNENGQLTGYEIFVLPQAWKSCDPKRAQVCTREANKPHARHYVIRVHATDKAGHSSTEDHVIEVALARRRRSLMEATMATLEGRERALQDVAAGRMFLLTEVTGSMLATPHH